VAIKGKARRLAHLNMRTRLKIGYSHKIFLFFSMVVAVVKTKYEILILKKGNSGTQQALAVQKELVYNQNGFWGRLGTLITKKGKRV